ncbi:SgcJ/EcaC family oxidoreductase [Rhodococcus maanshanensis]|uniref:SgcJ/EcaC family oxidoreductase n=1 Tax=Rhodococcus maanshanensis TaxID=183556 RepID=UPI0022B4D5C6|nr:SgcJ/EcaC family oxidoreductase [Rhodococcus maanshanensis]MCZ4557887.1 SgcJ/EcaC family oxidoreductase [Rhodococcus maanshanensis]
MTAVDTKPTTSGKSRRRTIVRVLGATALALGVTAAGGYLWLNQTSEVRNTGVAECTTVTPDGGSDADLRGVCATLSAMTEAWGRNDADAYGAVFTENASYTTFIGTHYQGRSDLTAAHRALFIGFLKDTKLADSYLGVRFYAGNVAIVTSRGDRYENDRPAGLSKTQTYTLVREQDGQWRIASFHNTQRQRVMERISYIFDPETKPQAER